MWGPLSGDIMFESRGDIRAARIRRGIHDNSNTRDHRTNPYREGSGNDFWWCGVDRDHRDRSDPPPSDGLRNRSADVSDPRRSGHVRSTRAHASSERRLGVGHGAHFNTLGVDHRRTSSSVLQSAYVGIKLGLLVGLTPFIIRYYSLERQSFTRYALTGFLAVQSMSAAAGLAQLAGASVAGLRANAGRANGLAIHPNVLGIMAAIAILVSFVLIHRTTGRTRLLAWGVIILNVAALIGSGSLSSMLSLAAGAVVLLVAMRATTRTVIRTCAAVVMCSALALTLGYNPSAAIDPIEGRVNTVLGLSNDGVASLSIRESTYEFAIDSIRSDPLIGVGMDSMHEGTFNGVTVVHNYLLRAWYQGGLLLFVTFLIVTIAMLGLACRSMISTRDGLQAAVITAVIVFGLTSAFYDQQQYWLPLLFAVAVTNRPTVQSTAPGGRLTSRAPRAVEKSKEEIRS
ncbi:O-antigen ligase family protein [Rhodococcus hoagii]|nr:O-antigen ligase family protein [Prescottella equi]